MKKKLVILSFIALAACSGSELKVSEGKLVVEKLIKTIDEEKYDEVPSFYTESFKDGETADKRNAKFKQLKFALGNVETMTLMDSAMKTGEQPELMLKYKVKHNRLSTIEIFN